MERRRGRGRCGEGKGRAGRRKRGEGMKKGMGRGDRVYA